MSESQAVALLDGEPHDRQDIEQKVEDLLNYHGLANYAPHEYVVDCARQITDLILEAARSQEVTP